MSHGTRPVNPRIRAIDALLRRDDTRLARALQRISPLPGRDYSVSRTKRALDLTISVPAFVASLPVIAAFGAVNKTLRRDHDAFFRQRRVGPGGTTLAVLKIRSMLPGPEGPSSRSRFTRYMRRHYLDELPQLAQVAGGQLSVVGIRILPRTVYDELARRWSEDRFAAWKLAYDTTPLGLTGIHQVLRRHGKEDARRYHRDVFYARNASLGLDLYILWRTAGSRDS